MSGGAGSARVKPRILQGMRDFLPGQMILRQRVMDTWRGVFERYGFAPIETPTIEYLEILTGKIGEDEKLIYHFEDHGGRPVGLRYDLTIPLARYIALHRRELNFPFKRYHIAPVFRADRPQRGRYRQFWQCDVDIVGSSSPVADAEAIMVWIAALESIHMPNFVVQINHRKLLQSLSTYAGAQPEQAQSIIRAIDKLAKIGAAGVEDEMLRHGVSDEAARRVLELVSLQGRPHDVLADLRERLAGLDEAQQGINDLEQIFSYLRDMGADPSHYTLDLALARGLDYYTGPVFEAVVEEPKIGSLGGGGRYDGLIGMFLGEEIPATGCSLGLERIVDVIEELGLLPQPEAVSKVLVTIFGDELIGASLALVEELRRGGVPAEIYLGESRQLRRQMEYANKRGIPVVAILGPDEVTNGTVMLRRMATSEQEAVPRGDAAAAVLRLAV
ncbi:MAG TPA: histidine--tRNA ligase [Thermomicrobiaceae bacterium]|nr:histidine--tRNA ligase [Thermomicrobiaceae bacterium]